MTATARNEPPDASHNLRVAIGTPWEASTRFAPGIRSPQGLIFLSGQCAVDQNGDIVGCGDLTAQTRQAFRNIESLLAGEGLPMSAIVKLTYYVTDMTQWPKVQSVREEFFPTYLAASTTVEVSRLHRSEYLIEIDVVASTAGE